MLEYSSVGSSSLISARFLNIPNITPDPHTQSNSGSGDGLESIESQNPSPRNIREPTVAQDEIVNRAERDLRRVATSSQNGSLSEQPNTGRSCNCRNKDRCPLGNKCLK